MDSHTPQTEIYQSSRFWNDYLSKASLSPLIFHQIGQYEQAFQTHQSILRSLAEKLQPNSSVILGAGFLSDIPIDALQKYCKHITNF